MQNVSAKWLKAHNDYLLPPTKVTVSYFAPDDTITGTNLGNIDLSLGSAPASFTVTLDDETDLNGKRLSFKWDDDNNKKPALITVKYYDDYGVEVASQSVNNYSVNVDIDIPTFAVGIKSFVITIDGYTGTMTLKTLNIETKTIFENTDLINVTLTQDVDLLSFTLPKAGLTFELNNADGAYNPDNPQGLLKNLSERELVNVTITQTFEDGTEETINGGEYFISEWEAPQNGISATFSARDGIEYMYGVFDGEMGTLDENVQACSFVTANGNGYIKSGIHLARGKSYEISMRIGADAQNGTILGGEDGNSRFVFGIDDEGSPGDHHFVLYYDTVEIRSPLVIATDGLYDVTLYLALGYGDNVSGDYDGFFSLEVKSHGVYGNNTTDWSVDFSAINGTLQVPATELYALAHNNNGSPQYFSEDVIYRFEVREKSETIGTQDRIFSPAYNTATDDYGLYDLAYAYYAPGINTYGTIQTAFTLYDLAYTAFRRSGIPDNPDGSLRFTKYLSPALANYAAVIPENYSHTYAETVQYCANAAGCVWYWDRQGQSHIEPYALSNRALPEGYKQCESIYIPNGAYINLGFVPENVTTYLDFSINKLSQKNEIIGGANDTGNYYTFNVYDYHYTWGANGNYYPQGDPITATEGRHSLVYNAFNDSAVILDGNVLGSGYGYMSAEPTSTVLLGKGYTFTDSNYYLYSILVVSKNTSSVLFDGIPCYNVQTDEAGLYDFVSGAFFGNQGTGTITHSPQLANMNYDFDLADLPEGYTQVAYISNNSNNDVSEIDLTDIPFVDNDNARLDFAILNGANEIWSSGSNALAYNASGKMVWNIDEISSQVTLNNRTALNMQDTAGSLIEINGDYFLQTLNVNAYGSSTTLIKSSGGKALLFRYKRYGAGDAIITDIVPCTRDSDDAVGVYDIVGGKFYPATNCVAGSKYTKGNYAITRFNSYQNAEYELTKELSAVNVNDGLGVYFVQKKGEIQTVDNPLVTDPDQAFLLARWIGENLKLRKSLNGEYRADTRADVGDTITVENKYATNNVVLTKVEYQYNGGFRGDYGGKAKQ